jgi:hypothetical protein
MASPSFAGGLRASDEFWDPLYDTCWFGAAFFPSPTFAEMVEQSDLIIVGRIDDMYIGEHWDGGDGYLWPLVYMRVAISDTLKGEARSRDPGTVEIQMAYAYADDLDKMRSRLPAHEHMWFLQLEDASDRGPQNQSPIAGFAYYSTDYPQTSILRNIHGSVEVIKPDSIARALTPQSFPVPLDGTDFEAVVERVRDMAAGSGRHAQIAAIQSRPSDEEAPLRFAC